MLRKLVLAVALVVFFGLSLKAETITVWYEHSSEPIGGMGLALCAATQSCAAGIGNAVASFDFDPTPDGTSEYTITDSNPSFAPIASYLESATGPLEFIVPYFWETGTSFTASAPDITYLGGPFAQELCNPAYPNLGYCGGPLPGSDIESLSLSVSPSGWMYWTAEGPNILATSDSPGDPVATPESPTLTLSLLGLGCLLGFWWDFRRCPHR